MNECKLKHLEFIQNIITRMNHNSFLLKGWAVILVSALFALAAKDADVKYVLVSYIAVPVFWILDGFFIATERKYRDLYSKVAKKNESEIDFSMDTTSYAVGNRTWPRGIFSKTLLPFYGVLIVVTLTVMFVITGVNDG
ncbi:MAG: hypothetical protein CMB97_00320 [Flavobacteriaceae bacterium]|nr:hypothetical protein [Flavobacteriaceae bacterium]